MRNLCRSVVICASQSGVVRKLLITLVILVLAVAAILGTWTFLGRQLSLSLDKFRTIEISSAPIHSVTYEGSGTGGWLMINDVHLSLHDSNPKLALSIGSTKDNQFAVASGGKVFAFGPTVSTAQNAGDYLAVVPQSGDKAFLVTNHSILSWPTLFDFNFMTGHSPSWKRYTYYQLVWKKPSGGALDMLWRYEQSFYGKELFPGTGWDSGFAVHEGSTGLIHLDIRP